PAAEAPDTTVAAQSVVVQEGTVGQRGMRAAETVDGSAVALGAVGARAAGAPAGLVVGERAVVDGQGSEAAVTDGTADPVDAVAPGQAGTAAHAVVRERAEVNGEGAPLIRDAAPERSTGTDRRDVHGPHTALSAVAQERAAGDGQAQTLVVDAAAPADGIDA